MHDGQVAYLNLTDMAKALKEKGKTVNGWLQSNDGKQILSEWEAQNSKGHLNLEFDQQIVELLSESNVISEGRIGLLKMNQGKYQDGLYAELGIAFEFANWLNPNFENLLKKEVEQAYKSGQLLGDGIPSEFDKAIDQLLKFNPKKGKL
ncbi:MAG: KilA-N domain-containing protein [Sphingobacteriales bacterium JAD_PAG50586_3]|nr:MAG: KilA-N domain-containing protein [Sphingobacteriales bacterium JAD_PAG50586_3]